MSTIPCVDCEDGTAYPFYFERLAAARTALYLASKASTSWKSTEPGAPHVVSAGTGTPSALFMSLAYYGGRIPMIGFREDPSLGRSWRAHCDSGTIQGADIWNAHSDTHIVPNGETYNANSPWTEFDLDQIVGNKLVHLMANARGLLPAEAVIRWDRPSRKALLVPGSKFFPAGQINAQYFVDPATTQEAQGWLRKINDFEAGDYVWYYDPALVTDEATGQSFRAAHGLMVVGRGPALDWGELARSGKEVYGVESHDRWGFTFGVGGHSTPVIDPTDQKLKLDGITDYSWRFFNVTKEDVIAARASFPWAYTVPYVADWREGVGNLKWQGARPFYATRFGVLDAASNLLDLQSMHEFWIFVPAPNSGSILCEYVLGINCEGAEIYVVPDLGVLMPCGSVHPP